MIEIYYYQKDDYDSMSEIYYCQQNKVQAENTLVQQNYYL